MKGIPADDPLAKAAELAQFIARVDSHYRYLEQHLGDKRLTLKRIYRTLKRAKLGQSSRSPIEQSGKSCVEHSSKS